MLFSGYSIGVIGGASLATELLDALSYKDDVSRLSSFMRDFEIAIVLLRRDRSVAK